MSNKTKLNLDRYKKSTQGIIEFARLLEQATPSMHKHIIDRTRKEDPKFLDRVMKRLIYFEEIQYIDESTLAEVLGSVPPKVLAYSLQNMNKEFVDIVTKQIDYRTLKQVQDEQEKAGITPTGLIIGAQKHILKVARKLEEQNKIVLDLVGVPRLQKKREAA